MIFFFFAFFLPSLSASDIETFQINLDSPPEERWKEPILAKKDFIHQYKEMVFQKIQTSDIPSILSDIRNNSYFSNSDFSREISGVAKYSNLSHEEVFLLNYMYEMFAACTSIVYENSNGEIVLGHNLDYFFTIPMGHSIVQLEFYKGGNLLYKAQAVSGQIGFFSALRPEAFALTINQRSKRRIGSLQSYLKSLFTANILPIIYTIRQGMEDHDDFENVVSFLSETKLGTNCYFILSGTKNNEGIVITRGPETVDDATRIDANKENDGWFLVQTNSDRNTTNYQTRDIRRFIAENRVRNIGRKEISAERVMKEVLYLSPNRNSITILSSVMSAQTGQFNTTMWV